MAFREVLSGNSAASPISRYKMLPYEGQLSMAEPGHRIRKLLLHSLEWKPGCHYGVQ